MDDEERVNRLNRLNCPDCDALIWEDDQQNQGCMKCRWRERRAKWGEKQRR